MSAANTQSFQDVFLEMMWPHTQNVNFFSDGRRKKRAESKEFIEQTVFLSGADFFFQVDAWVLYMLGEQQICQGISNTVCLAVGDSKAAR